MRRRTPVEPVPRGAQPAGEVNEEPSQRRGLLVQRETVEHLRFDNPLPRDADQVQAIAGGDDGKIVKCDRFAVAGTVLAECEQVWQVGRHPADVLGVRVGRRNGQLDRQRPVDRCRNGSVELR